MKENPKFRGVYLDENNNPIEGTEFEAWHSRSMAVTVVVTNEDHTRFLFEVRGPGCPDEVGKLCMPCGYVAWDEWTKESAVREVYEETGVRLDPDTLRLFSINDSPEENRQNITLRYIAELSDAEFDLRVVNGI